MTPFPQPWATTDIARNIGVFVRGDKKNRGHGPNERNASFDYCFNHFQSFRESGNVPALAEGPHLVESCLHLGFFLASWGMFRASGTLLRKSARCLQGVIGCAAHTPLDIWEIDAHDYTDEAIGALGRLYDSIAAALREPSGLGREPSQILVTKIMLGVFGNVPAFDNYFMQGSGLRGFGRDALAALGRYYRANQGTFDTERSKLRTFDFITGKPTARPYTRAKLLDMVFWVEGQKHSQQNGVNLR